MKKIKLNIQLFGASASVQSAKHDGRYLKLTVTETETSIENNTSTIYWKFESIGGNSSYYSIYNYGVYVNGSQVYDGTSGDKTKNYTNHSLPVIKGSKDGYVTIQHNPDGTAADISFSLHGKVYKSGTETHDGTLALTTIPRASQPRLSSSNVNMGNAVTIYTDRVSTSFNHTIRYVFGNANGTIATNVTDNVSWTPSIDLANQIPSATSGIGTIYCDTYSNGTLIGTKTINITLNVPSNVIPTVSFTNVSEAGDVPASWQVNNQHIFVKTKSRVALAISGGGVYSSSISSYRISYYGGAITTNSGTTSYLTQSGSTTFTGQVTDTRGRSNSATTTINVVDYYNPTISTAQVQRCDANGNIDNNGDYCYISYGASISSCSGQNTPNSVYKVGYRIKNTGSYAYVPLTTNTNSYSASGILYTDGIYPANRGSGTKVQFDTSNTYDIQFYVKDYFSEIVNLQSLDTGFDLMNFNASGKSMAIGKVSEAGANEELFEIGMNTNITGTLAVDKIDYYKGLYFKENGYGDKFMIIPYFGGADDSNILLIQSAVGGAGTDPALGNIFGITALSGNVWSKGTYNANNGFYSKPDGNVSTQTPTDALVIKRATAGVDDAPSNGVVLEYGRWNGWGGQLYIGDNADQGIYYNGWSNGTRGTWKKLAFEEETNWVECTIANGFEQLSWNTLVYKKKNGIVTIMGAVNTTATTSFGKNITTLPSGFRPLKEFDIVCRAGGEVVKVAITSNGQINVLDTGTGGNLNSGTGIFISATYIAWEG